MKCFGLIAVANMKCGRLMRQATSSRSIKANLWEDEVKFKLISMEMVTPGLVTVETIGDASS